MRLLLSAIYPYAFMMLYLIIPFDDYIRALPNILVAILVVAFPFTVKKEDFRKLKSLPIIIFLGLFAFLCINSFLAGRMEDFKVIKKVMIAAGLLVLYIPVNDINFHNGRIGKINTAIIFSALAAIIFSVYHFVLITDTTGSFTLGESPQVVESLLVDRLYLGMLSTFSILISVQALHKKYHPTNNYFLANILVNAIFIVLIASKIAMVALIVLLLISQFYGKRKIWKVIITLASISAIIGLFFLLENEEKSIDNGNTNYENVPSFIENSVTFQLRAVVWNCAQKVINDEGFTFTGIGFNETKDRLVTCYQSNIEDRSKMERFATERYNTHNQFIDFYISAGFIALLLFLTFIAISFFTVRRNFYKTAMLTILILYCLFENVFHRQMGAYYIGFILIALTTITKAGEDKKIITNNL